MTPELEERFSALSQLLASVGIPRDFSWDAPVRPDSLSLGEMQLICAMRSVMLSRQIILFDEISSGLDGKLEQGLQVIVQHYLSRQSLVAVAHRIETLRESREVILIDEGKIIERGTHEKLSESNGTYREFLSLLG